MYRVLATSVFLAAAALTSNLGVQIRTTQRPNLPAQTCASCRVRRVGSGAFGVAVLPRLRQPRLFVGPNRFPRHLRFSIFLGNSCFTNVFFGPFFCRQFFFPSKFVFAQPVFLPYPVYTAPYYPTAERAPAADQDREGDLSREVERLRGEVEQLRQDQAVQEQARLASPEGRTSAEEKGVSTVLVFGDGHRSEVQNFAIVGQTIWVFTEQRARRIPVSKLDVEATKKANVERGTEFRYP
jgi:hypothetical protein